MIRFTLLLTAVFLQANQGVSLVLPKEKILNLQMRKGEVCKAIGGVCLSPSILSLNRCLPVNGHHLIVDCGFNIFCCKASEFGFAVLQKTEAPRARKTCSAEQGLMTEITGGMHIGSLPGFYNDNEHCTWEIRARRGEWIYLEWEYVSIEGSQPECYFDYAEVFDKNTGNSLSGRVCGHLSPPPIRSQSNWISVVFVSDGSIQDKGFELNYMIVPDMNSAPSGRVTLDPEGYANNVDQNWAIQGPPGVSIAIDWIDIDIEGPFPNCPYDYVIVLDAKEQQILSPRFCGTELQRPIITSANEVTVHFHSDDSVVGQGFTLVYWFREVNNTTITQPEVTGGSSMGYSSETSMFQMQTLQTDGDFTTESHSSSNFDIHPRTSRASESTGNAETTEPNIETTLTGTSFFTSEIQSETMDSTTVGAFESETQSSYVSDVWATGSSGGISSSEIPLSTFETSEVQGESLAGAITTTSESESTTVYYDVWTTGESVSETLFSTSESTTVSSETGSSVTEYLSTSEISESQTGNPKETTG